MATLNFSKTGSKGSERHNKGTQGNRSTRQLNRLFRKKFPDAPIVSNKEFEEFGKAVVAGKVR